MYTNTFYCSDYNYVKSNLGKNMVIEYIEINSNDLPLPIYEDDPSRYWEIWKKHRGYKLYNIENIVAKVFNEEDSIIEGMVRLYRTAPKSLMQSKPKPEPVSGAVLPKNTVPCEVVIEG